MWGEWWFHNPGKRRAWPKLEAAAWAYATDLRKQNQKDLGSDRS